MYMLKIKNLFFSYKDKVIIKNLNLFLEPGKIASLIGSSGSGKTTLFRLLTGIITSEKGCFTIDSPDAPSYMTQQDLLLPWRTVLENIMLVSELGKKKSDKAAVRKEAMELLADMGLEEYRDQLPSRLSGGMRQRVSLARALIQKSPLLLLDEPFASLDVSMREQMYELLRKLRAKYNTTILMVTHDFRDALSLSDHIFYLSGGEIKEEWEINQEKRADNGYFGELFTSLRNTMKSESKDTFELMTG